MPVTFHPSTVPLSRAQRDNRIQDASTLLRASCRRNESIIQTSFAGSSTGIGTSRSGDDVSASSLTTDPSSPTDLSAIQPVKHGLIYACLAAYNQHHHLVLRPDDIWLAILSQFGLYIDVNSERFRAHFVSHAEGKKELTVYEGGNRHTVDFGMLARRMAALVDENLTDPELGGGCFRISA